MKTVFFTSQNNPTNLNLQLQLNLHVHWPISWCYCWYPTTPHSDMWRLSPLLQYLCHSFTPVPLHSNMMLPVLIHPDLYHSMMSIAVLCSSVLIRTTMWCLAPICVTYAALYLSVSLLPDMCRYVLLCDTKICPDNNEELIFNSKIMDEHGWSRDTLTYCYNSYFLTPFSTILDTSIAAPKIWYGLIKNNQETTIFFSSKPLRTWLGIKSVMSTTLNLLPSISW